LRVKFATRAPGAGGASFPPSAWANPKATARSMASEEDIVFLQSFLGKRQRPTVSFFPNWRLLCQRGKSASRPSDSASRARAPRRSRASPHPLPLPAGRLESLKKYPTDKIVRPGLTCFEGLYSTLTAGVSFRPY